MTAEALADAWNRQGSTSSVPDLQVLDWGTLEYGQAFERQKAWVEERISDRAPDRLVLVEHPPTVTIGRSGGAGDLRVPERALRERDIAVYDVDRGGMATFHGPGQLVAYPILKLRERDLHRYLDRLLGAVADVVRGHGLTPELREKTPGVWVGGAKIASVGVAVRRWVTYHGVALNVSTDRGWFDWIVPCGNPGERITSLEAELDRAVGMPEVKRRFEDAFRRSFGYATGAGGAPRRHPPWLVRPAPGGAVVGRTEEALRAHQLATVCEGAHCPNLGECYGRGTATFLILGSRCTRDCRFCALEAGAPEGPDPGEPARVAAAARTLGLSYVVVTSVTRDDLSDGGAGQFCETIRAVREACPGAGVEVLIPDLGGSVAALELVCGVRPDVLNHNVETVPRLYSSVRPQAVYRRSLAVLEYAARQGLRVKSGLMLGLGEAEAEVREVLRDLRRTGCGYLTLGQYLAPSPEHAPVARYVPPEEFESWAETAGRLGFEGVASGPLVRSSYRADALAVSSSRRIGTFSLKQQERQS